MEQIDNRADRRDADYPPRCRSHWSASPPPDARPTRRGWLLPHGDPFVNDDINVLALIKGKERYIFLYDDSQRAEALRMLGRHASNPELSFNWYDAAVLSQRIRQEARQQQRARLRMPQVTDGEELF